MVRHSLQVYNEGPSYGSFSAVRFWLADIVATCESLPHKAVPVCVYAMDGCATKSPIMGGGGGC
jgi:hypothetical protein